MYKKPQDEWGVIINQQAELNRRREQEEKQRALQEKDRYRQDLEQQAFVNQRKKEEEQRLRDVEASKVRTQVKAFQSEEERRKQQELQIQKSLADEYLYQASSVKNRQVVEQRIKLKQEQDLIRYNQELLEQEKRQKRVQKEQLQQEKLEMLQAKALSERKKQDEAKNQMLYDLEQLRQKKEQEEKKEKDYRDYFERVGEQQLKKQQLYNQKVGFLNAEKDYKLSSWVSKSVDQYQKLMDDKMQQEKRVKQNNLENVKETLKYQVEEKNRAEYLKNEERKKLSDEVQRKIEENRKIEEEKMRNKKMMQYEYFNHLSSQSTETNEMRSSMLKLSEVERKMNKNYSMDTGVGRNNLSLGAQEILKKPNYRANSNFATPFDVNGNLKNKNSLSSSNICKPFENALSPVNEFRA